MALSDPQTITYATVSKALARQGFGSDNVPSSFGLDDGSSIYKMTVLKSAKKRKRYIVRLQRDSIVTDPLVPANSMAVSMSASVTVDLPLTGLAAADGKNLVLALQVLTNDATFMGKVLNGEV